eukprot:g29534.t1
MALCRDRPAVIHPERMGQTQSFGEKQIIRHTERVPAVVRKEDLAPDDAEGWYKAQMQEARAEVLLMAKMTLIKEELHDCVLAHGLNHREECRDLALLVIDYSHRLDPYAFTTKFKIDPEQLAQAKARTAF